MNKPKDVLTLCLLRRGNQLALAQKLRGFGVGKWNGYGGHVEDGESVTAAAVREVLEESGGSVNINPSDLRQVAKLTFHFFSDQQIREVHVFVADRWEGELHGSEEMSEPQWFAAADLPAIREQMWAADRFWLPVVLEGQSILGIFMYNADGSRVADYLIIKATF